MIKDLIRSLLRNRLRQIAGRSELDFAVTFTDGSELSPSTANPGLHLRFVDVRGERACVLYGHVGFLESYFEGHMEIEGDLAEAVKISFESGYSESPPPLVRIRNRWHEFTLGNRTIGRAKDNARFHYGLGAGFYEKWLDLPYMMYTCAYWAPGTTSVEQAQINKMEHVCRKVRLSPGDSVLDIGCGFGGFMYYAHQRDGVSVKGINTTTEQVDWLRQRIEEDGLGHALEVSEADFREDVGRYDKVISIGVLEHAGRDQLGEVVRAHANALKPGGIGMLHFIGHIADRETEFYIRKYVFPGGWIPSLSDTLDVMESCGLDILDVENLRRHYALTLDEWAERFNTRWDEIHALDPAKFDARFRRIWKTYLESCAEMFRSPQGTTGLYQILYSKGNVTAENFPMSRGYVYHEKLPGGEVEGS